MPFEFFDPHEEISVSYRHLPHWEQPEKTYFVTFRTLDSLPSHVLGEWQSERDGWLSKHAIDVRQEDWHIGLERLPRQLREEYHCRFSEKFHDLLDQGHGECLLRREDLAKIVAQSLTHFDKDRYTLADFVVMPNHVHVLVQVHGPTRIKKQGRSWKKFTAGEINRAIGRTGHFWLGESHDHLVRDLEEFRHYREYIAENPSKAKLRSGEFYYYHGPEE